jgi:hypothetical protein
MIYKMCKAGGRHGRGSWGMVLWDEAPRQQQNGGEGGRAEGEEVASLWKLVDEREEGRWWATSKKRVRS